MKSDADVYDLGEIASPGRALRGAAGVRDAARAGPSTVRASAPGGPLRHAPGPGLTSSLSLIVPGLGQTVAGEMSWGVFYLVSMAFLAALVWAILETFQRLVATLDLLGASPIAVPLGLGVVFGAGAILHVAGVVHAHRLGWEPAVSRRVHPALTGAASLLVPGWGQMLNGARIRGAILMSTLWACAAAWLVGVSPLRGMFSSAGAHLPAALDRGPGPIALLAVPLVLWSLAVYDAVATSSARSKP